MDQENQSSNQETGEYSPKKVFAENNDIMAKRVDWRPDEYDQNSEEEKEESEVDLSRVLGQATLARVEKFDQLNADTIEEGEAKFAKVDLEVWGDETKMLESRMVKGGKREQFGSVWRELAVHGKLARDKETGKPFIAPYSDLDGKCAEGLLALAYSQGDERKERNFRRAVDIEFVKAGKSVEGKINLDTGNRFAVAIDDYGKTVFMDHHDPDTGEYSSATDVVYRVLNHQGKLNFLDDRQRQGLGKLVTFVNQVDNLDYPEMDRYWQISDQCVLGLNRFIRFNELRKFFTDGSKEPHDILTADEMESMGLIPAAKKENGHFLQDPSKEHDRPRQQRNAIEAVGGVIEEAKKNGQVVELGKNGKALILFNQGLPEGFWAARASGFQTMIYYSPNEDSVFITSVNDMEEKFSQGFKMRKKMWLVPELTGEPLKLTLTEILVKLMDDEAYKNCRISGKVLEQIKKENQK